MTVSWLDSVRETFGEPAKANVIDLFDPARPYQPGRGIGYAQAAVANELEKLRNAPRPIPGVRSGGRNHQLFKSTAALSELVAGGELGEYEVVSALTGVAREIGLRDDEINATIRSGMARGPLKPRTAPTKLFVANGHGTVTEQASPAGDGALPPNLTEQWTAKLESALVDSLGLDGIPDPDPLIGNDLVFRDSLVWVVGKPGCMKSFTVLDMAGCVGTGEMWQGYQVVQGSVLYLVAEGVRGVKKRVRAWEKSMGRRMDNVYFLPIAVQASQPAPWNALIEVIKRVNPTMIVIDTQARVTVGVEENSNSEMGVFVDQAERLRHASGAAVFIVHHIGRNGDTGRGATTVDGAVSTIIRVSKDDLNVKLECQKNKDGAEWDEINLRAVPTEESVVLMISDGLRPSRDVNGPSPAAMKTARNWWDNHGDKWAGNSSLIDVVAPKTTFFRHREELVNAGLVGVNHEGRYPAFRLLRSPYPDEDGPP